MNSNRRGYSEEHKEESLNKPQLDTFLYSSAFREQRNEEKGTISFVMLCTKLII